MQEKEWTAGQSLHACLILNLAVELLRTTVWLDWSRMSSPSISMLWTETLSENISMWKFWPQWLQTVFPSTVGSWSIQAIRRYRLFKNMNNTSLSSILSSSSPSFAQSEWRARNTPTPFLFNQFLKSFLILAYWRPFVEVDIVHSPYVSRQNGYFFYHFNLNSAATSYVERVAHYMSPVQHHGALLDETNIHRALEQ